MDQVFHLQMQQPILVMEDTDLLLILLQEEQAVTLVVGLHQVLEAELEQPAQPEHLDLRQVLLV